MGTSASKANSARHRSLNCRQETFIEFVNCTGHTVQTVWLDYNGNHKCYFTLAPAARVRQPTFTAHPWTFKVRDSPSTLCVVDNQEVIYGPPPAADSGAAPQARIVEAGSVPWSAAHHRQFPPDFHAQTVALLCCHRRLCSPPASAPTDQQQQAGWLRRWRQLREAVRAPAPTLRAHPASPAAATGHTFHLGDLPKELLLEVLAAAAPTIPLIERPALPYSVEAEELSEEALGQLFRSSTPAEAAVK